MSTPTTVAGRPPSTRPAPLITAPSGSGLVVIPGNGVPGQSQPSGRPAVPGPQNDGADFFGFAAALAVVVLAVVVVRRLVPLRRGSVEGQRPGRQNEPGRGEHGRGEHVRGEHARSERGRDEEPGGAG